MMLSRLASRRIARPLTRSFSVRSAPLVQRSVPLALVLTTSVATAVVICWSDITPSHLENDVITTGTPAKEAATGILFPRLCNGLYFAGCGVRVKYGFVKVYAVGTYLDPLAMSAVKQGGTSSIEQALLDPTYPRTIRIVMNRGLSVDKFTAAIVEAMEPRLKGQDVDKLEEFKKLNPPVDLVKGAEIEMTIRGDTLLYKNATGGVGTIRSRAFCEAMCDVYYGVDPVSPTHKHAVLEGVPSL